MTDMGTRRDAEREFLRRWRVWRAHTQPFEVTRKPHADGPVLGKEATKELLRAADYLAWHLEQGNA